MTTHEVATYVSQRRGWSLEKATEKVRALHDTGKWGLTHFYFGFRANFKCEYCGLDLLSSPDAYKLWEKDHIVRGAGDDLDNLALSCLVCNCQLKNRLTLLGASNDRDRRICEVQDYVKRKRESVAQELDEWRRLLELVLI